MKRFHSWLGMIMLVVAVLIIGTARPSEAAQSYTAVALYANGEAFDINERDEIVGRADDSAALWKHGVMTRLDRRRSEARGINTQGQIVGVTYDDLGQPYAALWSKREAVALAGDWSGWSDALDLNDRGQIVGNLHDDDLGLPIVWKNRKMTILPGGRAFAQGINTQGQIVGVVYNELHHPRPALWEKGKLTILEGGWGIASDINDRGQIVGMVFDERWNALPARWENGAMILLPGAWGAAQRINTQGQIVGWVGDQPVMWEQDQLITLSRGWGIARGINDHGYIVGQANGKAMLWLP
jgi:uncharacterized membrane protein